MRYIGILALLWATTTQASEFDFKYFSSLYSGGTFSTRAFLVTVIKGTVEETGSEGEAIKQSVEAFSKTEKPSMVTNYVDGKVNENIKEFENFLLSYSPVERETLVLVGSAAFMAKEGKVSTSLIKKLDVEAPLGGKMRPDAEFSWRNMTAIAQIKVGWNF